MVRFIFDEFNFVFESLCEMKTVLFILPKST